MSIPVDRLRQVDALLEREGAQPGMDFFVHHVTTAEASSEFYGLKAVGDDLELYYRDLTALTHTHAQQRRRPGVRPLPRARARVGGRSRGRPAPGWIGVSLPDVVARAPKSDCRSGT